MNHDETALKIADGMAIRTTLNQTGILEFSRRLFAAWEKERAAMQSTEARNSKETVASSAPQTATLQCISGGDTLTERDIPIESAPRLEPVAWMEVAKGCERLGVTTYKPYDSPWDLKPLYAIPPGWTVMPIEPVYEIILAMAKVLTWRPDESGMLQTAERMYLAALAAVKGKRT